MLKDLSKQDFYEEVHQYRNDLVSVATMILRDNNEAEDAVSEAVIKAHKKITQLRDDTKIYPWMRKIVHNLCIDILRQKVKKKTTVHNENVISDSDMNISERIEVAEKIEQILDIMLDIRPEEYREVLILYFYRKMKYQEIAEALQISEGTVKSRLSRGKDILKNSFDKHGITKDDLFFIQDMEDWPLIIE